MAGVDIGAPSKINEKGAFSGGGANSIIHKTGAENDHSGLPENEDNTQQLRLPFLATPWTHFPPNCNKFWRELTSSAHEGVPDTEIALSP